MNKESSVLETICHENVPGAYTAFLGGSRGSDGGQHQLPGSDYDVVVLTEHTDRPYSLNHHCDLRLDHSMDLIVRDEGTMAFELQECKRRGRAAIPQIIANGIVLFDDKNNAARTQAAMQDFLEQGPSPLDAGDYARQYHTLAQHVEDVRLAGATMRKLTSYELVHHAATLHLHHNKKWYASGKLLGRFLLQDQQFKQNIESVFRDIQFGAKSNGVIDPFPVPVDECKPKSSKLVNLASWDKDRDIYDAFLIRYSPETLADALQRPQNKTRAETYMAGKLYTLSQALNPQRIGRASNEYFYALCRVVYNFSEMVMIAEHGGLGESIIERYEALQDHCPPLTKIVTQAQQGQPDALKNAVEDFSASLSPCYKDPVKTVSPGTFRY